MTTLSNSNGHTPSAYELVKRRVLARVTAGELDPHADVDTVYRQIDEVVRAWQREAHLSDDQEALADPTQMTRRVMAAVCDYGPLSPLLARDDVEEIMIHRDQLSYIAADGEVYFPTAAAGVEEYRAHVDRLLATAGRQVSYAHPIEHATLPGNIRLSVAVWPRAKEGLVVNVRKPVLDRPSLARLVAEQTLSPAAAGLLWAAMQTRSRLVIAGAQSAGKTTLANALLGAIPPKRVVRVVEEYHELSMPLTLGAHIEAGHEPGQGLGECIRDMMRFRTEWLVVGEVLGSEAKHALRAFNAGCGVLTTLHCNRAADAIPMLTEQVALATDVGTDRLDQTLARALDLVVFIDADGDDDTGTRREVCEIAWVQPELRDGCVVHEPIFVRDEMGAPLTWTGSRPDADCARRLERGLPAGVSSLTALLDGRATVEAVRK